MKNRYIYDFGENFNENIMKNLYACILTYIIVSVMGVSAQSTALGARNFDDSEEVVLEDIKTVSSPEGYDEQYAESVLDVPYRRFLETDDGCAVFYAYCIPSVKMSVKWDGECVNGKATGYGKAEIYCDGKFAQSIKGYFINGKVSGHGTIQWSNNTTYEGDIEDNMAIGEGLMVFENGTKFEGNFNGVVLHGDGKITYESGLVFEGKVCQGIPYTGTYTMVNGEKAYIQESDTVSFLKFIPSKYNPQLGVPLIEYFDNDFKRCDAKKAAYYRKVTYSAPHKPKGEVKDYYITGHLLKRFYAKYLDYDYDGLNVLDGDFSSYYQDGRTYLQNNYIMGQYCPKRFEQK